MKSSPERFAALVAAVEAADDGVYVTDRNGRALYENAGLRRLLTGEPQRRTLEDAIADARRVAGARAEIWVRSGGGPSDPSRGEERAESERITPGYINGPSVTLAIRTPTVEYQLRSTTMRGGDGPRQEMITVVWVRRCRPRILTPQMLRDRYGLTAREARVAALVAARAGSREIAEALGISPHTARRHAEAVLRKLGVHSRADVRERLRE